ncbi:MAG TPA: hypothetical protein VMF08_07375 [Candidatus Sulfotelmatobacter sp.]|nr:hypothetical protein [Candidatus Sulfotelmatobacter sp.]
MKTTILISALAVLVCWNTAAQTANELISQGESDLAVHDLADANTNFAQAVALSPTNETANAFYAITRLLVLPSEPVGSNFLTRLGVPVSGRNIYHWTAIPPLDTNDVPLAPVGVNADEFTAQLRANVLPAITSAISNLAVITDTNFTLDLTSGETSITDVTVDYGDLKLIQAGLYGAEYLIYTLNAQNLDAQLSDIRALYTNGNLSAGQMLANYPQLFTFATTNDMQAAQAAFSSGVDAYMVASAFIRARPPGEVRLFNYDQISAQDEGDFRLTLQDLEDSLVLGPQWMSLDPNLAVNMGAQFSGTTTWRSLLPAFDGNAIELGSFPDLTFGGLLYGLSDDDVEGFLGKYLTMLPVGSAPVLSSSNTVNVTFTTLAGRYYALEASTNLMDWQVVDNFTASNDVTVEVDPAVASQRFYRLRDDSAFLAFSGQVFDQNTGLPIAGAQVQSLYDGTSAFTGPSGYFYLVTTLPASYGYDELGISATGYDTVDNFYFGNGLVSGLQIYLSAPPPNDDFANRTILAGSNISTNGNNSGATQESEEPPDNTYGGYGGKSVWFSWIAPATSSYLVSVSTTTVYNPILAIYTGSQLSSLSTVTDTLGYNYYAGYTLNATAGQTYQIEIDDYEGNGGPYTLNIAP